MSGSVVDVNVHCHIERHVSGRGGGLETQSGLSAIWYTVSAESSALENMLNFLIQNFSKMVGWDDVTCSLMYRRKHTK